MAPVKQARGWGSHLKDFEYMINGKKTNTTPSTEKHTRNGNKSATPSLPSVHVRHNELDRFLKRHFRCNEVVSFIQDFDSSDEEGDSTSDEDVKASALEEFFEQINLTLPEGVVESYTHALTELGPAKPLNEYPTAIRKQVFKHDRDYKKTMDSIFERAAKYTFSSEEDKLFTRAFWRWLQANQDPTSRDRILSILLHPHIRSVRVRAAIGKENWENLSEDLGMKSIDSVIPEVLGTYHLEAVTKPYSTALNQNARYCGRGIKYSGDGTRGVRHRFKFYKGLLRPRQESRGEETARPILPANRSNAEKEWAVARRLTHPDVEDIHYCLLSTFPPVLQTRQEIVHFHCLLNLAESIDMILLDTISDSARAIFGGDFAHSIRPRDMPSGDFEGLNRALPTSQALKMPMRLYWEPKEIIMYTQVLRKYQSEIYADKILWDVFEEKLRQEGISKSSKLIKSLYTELVIAASELVEPYCSWSRKRDWSILWQFKQFVSENDLIEPPDVTDETDLYYHIPELETGDLSYHQVAIFKDRHGLVLDYAQIGSDRRDTKAWWVHFGTRFLPHALLREVWDQITDEPPTALHIVRKQISFYLMARTRDVVNYHIRQLAKENQDHLPHFVMDWRHFLEVYLRASARLIADGIPRDRVLPHGVLGVVVIYDHRNYYQQPCQEDLSPWIYEARKDTNARDIHKPASKSNLQMNDDFEDVDDQIPLEALDDGHTDYLWPSDAARYDVLAEQLGRQTATCDRGTDTLVGQRLVIHTGNERNLTGQNKVSSFRVIVDIAKTVHTDGFVAEDYTDDEFWSHLWQRLNEPILGTMNLKSFKTRFWWLLHYIRTGELPSEPAAVIGSFQQILYGSKSATESYLHPYNVDPGCYFDGEFVNPDLDGRWIQGFLRRDNTAAKVLSHLSNLYNVNISVEKISEHYGILIAYAFELACVQGYCRLRDKNPQSGSLNASNNADMINSAESGLTESISSKPDEPDRNSATSIPEAKGTTTEEQLMEVLRNSAQSGSAFTWMWLLLHRPRPLDFTRNTTLEKEILKIDPDFRLIEKRICVKLRKELGVTEYLEDKDFSYHQRYLPPDSCVRPGNPNTHYTFNLQFLISDAGKHPCTIYYDPARGGLENGCVIFFEDDGIKLKARDGKLLQSFAKENLSPLQLKLYTHEMTLRHSLPNPKPDSNCLQNRWSLEELTWLFELVPEDSTDSYRSDLASLFEARFGYHRPHSTITKCLRTNSRPREVKDKWSATQRGWIVSQAKIGTSWDDMEKGFRKKFTRARSAPEIKEEVRKIQALMIMPLDEQPPWVTTLPLLNAKKREHHYSKEQIEWIVEQSTPKVIDGVEFASEIHVQKLAMDFNKKFKANISIDSFSAKRSQLAREHSEMEVTRSFKKAEIDFLRESKHAGRTMEETRKNFHQEFGIWLKRFRLEAKWGTIPESSSSGATRPKRARQNAIRDGKKVEGKKLATRDSESSVVVSSIPRRKPQKKKWTNAEMNFIRNYKQAGKAFKDLKAAFEERFDYPATRSSLRHRFYEDFGLRKRKRNVVDSKEDVETMSDDGNTTSDDDDITSDDGDDTMDDQNRSLQISWGAKNSGKSITTGKPAKKPRLGSIRSERGLNDN